MKLIRILTAFLICISVIIMPSCKKFGSFSSSDSLLKIGITETEGNFNPFYSTNESDSQVVSQMFIPIQIKGTNNKLINHSGGISYELVGNNQVKYTVSIKDNLFFSDGTNITIDDVISFYHFIADASYNGTYSNWYLNDISGLKEFYFDDKNYKKSLSEIENKVSSEYTVTNISEENYILYLKETNIEGRFDGNIDSASPYNSTWKEYIQKSEYGYKLAQLGKNPSSEDLLNLICEIEAKTNRYSYNPETYYREKFYSEYINRNYSDGINVTSIDGIKKINDYTCTVLFNSKNINDISQLNVLLVPTDYLFAEYIKGSAEKVNEIRNIAVSSGPYVLNDYNEKEITMSANRYYFEGENEFGNLEFIVVDDLVKSIKSGKVDIITTDATSENINQLDSEKFVYTVTNKPSYFSFFFNTRSLDKYARKALMCLSSTVVSLEDVIGPYYSKLYSPMSIRFSETPQKNSDEEYIESNFAFNSHLTKSLTDLKAYYCGTEDDMHYIALLNLKNNLAKNNLNLEIVLCDDITLEAAITSGEADIWIDETFDGATCDRYDVYNSNGSSNLTAINDPVIDNLTLSLREAVGFADKAELTAKLMNSLMDNAVEYPLYQLQNVTVYNTEVIDESSVTDNKSFDGYTYIIPWLTQQKG